MQQIQMIYAEGSVSQYRIRKTEGADEITYYIYFVLDEKGIWKIQQFQCRQVMRIRYFILLASVMLLVSACTISNEWGPYEGKVVDAETGEPIEGAAVFVAFYFERIGIGGTSGRYIASQETMTDANGEFRLPAKRINAFRVLATWGSGHFRIFKPGYGCYPNHKDVKPVFAPAGTLPAGKHVVVQLPRLMTKEARYENYGCYASPSVPRSDYKTLFRLIQQEREHVGLEPIEIPE